ncbi:MAG: DEAD/DEAH box helicase, partial [Candidatus Heimdallarchaeota archaeon]
EESITYAKTVFLVPLRALAEEKANDIARTYRKYKLKVHLSMSDIDFDEEEIAKCHILISTYERFRTIIGRIPSIIGTISNVVVDEFHIIGNEHRGPVLETILTSLLGKVRLILLSATVENPKEIANWLQAQLIISDKRFIPLDYRVQPTLLPEREVKKIIEQNIANESQILVFCGTRSKTEEYALDYADFIQERCKKTSNFNPLGIHSFLGKMLLSKNTVGNKLLFELTTKGTAIHHAGLSRLAKKAVEELYRQNAIKVLFCTETLGAGINLPAREVVILDTKRWNNDWLSRNVFHQIAGRAGRPNYDTYGKCTILTTDGREKRSIISRYWKSTNRKSENPTGKTKPQYDKICSMISNKNEFEKMVLTLIYSNNPTKNVLLELLKKSFFEHKNTNSELKNRENYNDTSLSFFELFLETNSNFEDIKRILEMYYPIRNMELIQIFEAEETQTFQIMDGLSKILVTLNSTNLKCTCKESNLICRHKFFVLNNLARGNAVGIFNRNYSILDKLIIDGYVIEKADGILQTTSKGNVWAEMGISRRKFEFVKDWLLYDLFIKKLSLTLLLHECIRMQPVVESDGYKLNNLEFKRPIYEHVILKQEFIDVVTKHRIFEGDLLRVEVGLKSLIASLLPLTEFLGLEKIKKQLENLDLLLSEALRLS